MEVNASQVQQLRAKTGAGIMDCKKALKEANGNFDKAVEELRLKGLATAAKKAGRVAAEGIVGSYIHAGGKIGVLIEVNCETDFVGRNEDFQRFVKDVSMHIAAANPSFVQRADVSPEVIERERAFLQKQVAEENKPANVAEKMVEGRLNKFFKEICLLEQPFVRDADKTVEQILSELTAKIGERVVIRRFVRFQLGEGIEKIQEDFATEVAKVVAG